VRPPMPPKPAQDGSQHSAELGQLLLACHVIIVPVR
jgi:hypothetical protein